MSIVTSIMSVTLKCQSLIRRGDPASLAAALRSRSEFHSHVGFLYLVLAKLVKRGCVCAGDNLLTSRCHRLAARGSPPRPLSYLPRYNLHLEDILLRLDFRCSFCVSEYRILLS
jgi:hypothetical protein